MNCEIVNEFPKMSKMDYICSKNIDPELVALEYFGVKVTYGDLESTVLDYSKKLHTLGVKENDSVALCLPNTIESAELFLAVNERGAVCNNIFPLSNSEQIKYCLNLLDSEIIFILDSKIDELNKVITQTKVKKVVLVSPFESLKGIGSFYGLLKHKAKFSYENVEYYSFNEFKKVYSTDYIKPTYKENRLSSVQYTSGTTGVPKAVALTDDCFNARAYQYSKINVGIEYGIRFLQSLPFCGIAYGEFTLHLGLCNACCNVLVPKFSSDDILKLIKKYDIQGISTTPIAWLNAIDSKEFCKSNFNNFKVAAVGGDGAIKKHMDMIQNALESKGFKNKVVLGAGGTELGVSFSTNTNDDNCSGTSGKPLYGNECIIINSFGKECKTDEIGTVYYKPIYPCIGYLNDYTLNSNSFGIDIGDCGYIDKDGNLTVVGRKDDAILIDDEVVYPMMFEKEINNCKYVKYGFVVEPKNSSKKIRICYTSYDGQNDYYDSEILNYVDKKYHKYIEINRIKYIPKTSGLKIDRQKLSENIDDLSV